MSHKYLLHCNGIGAIIKMPRNQPSPYWGQVQDGFVAACGYDPTTTRVDMISLWPDCVADGVSYDAELVNRDGMSFRLHKLPDTTDKQIYDAKRKIRRDQDVVRMMVLHIKRLINFKLPEIK